METTHNGMGYPVLATTSLLDRHFYRLQKKRGGWASLRPRLFELSPRWQWWALVLLNKSLPPPALPYPKIEFAEVFPDQAPPMKMLRDCLRPTGARFEDLIEWALYKCGAFDIRNPPRRADQDLLSHWEKTFDLKIMLDHPGDWLGHFYEVHVASASLRSATGFFSSPAALCKLMVSLNPPGLTESVHEPCCGSGRILMAASNYSVNLSGNDVNPTLCRIAELNGWIYVPWLVMPCRELKPEEQKLERKLKTVLERRAVS